MKKGSKLLVKKRIELTGFEAAMRSAVALVATGNKFQLDPRPHGKWELTVRHELDIDEKGLPL